MMTEPTAPCFIDFPNGYGIWFQEVNEGKAFYQVWPPGVANQSMFSNCYWKPLEDFREQVKAEGGSVAEPGEVQKGMGR